MKNIKNEFWEIILGRRVTLAVTDLSREAARTVQGNSPGANLPTQESEPTMSKANDKKNN
jgi:hypothetical protein